MKRAWVWARIREVRARRWWWQQDHRYGLRWRLANGAMAALMLAAACLPVLQYISTQQSYRLSAGALKLVGNTDARLAKQLTYDTSTSTYQFNKAAIKSADSNPFAQLQSQVGTASGGKDKSLYALDVPQELSKGVTYHDINSSLAFSLVPQFDGSAGRVEQGHLVFPLPDDAQAVYTLKNNGLKEDIIVQKTAKDSLSFTYDLKLPKTLEARMIPDGGGAVGIYSADPSLFGNISYGNDSDRAAVEKVREKSSKTNLVFGLPAPVIKTTDGASHGSASARFELNGSKLSVVAEGLSSLKAPFTIDPSVVVSSTSDFQTNGNSEDNIDFSTSGQIGRSGLTGGTIPSWSSTSAFNQAASGIGTAAYNGYLYMVSGSVNGGTGNKTDSVQFAVINSTGTLGSWHYTHSSTDDSTTYVSGFGQVSYQFGVVAYDGYLYVVGGQNGSAVYTSTYYAPINTNGTVGTWATTSSLGTARYGYGLSVSQGYMYAVAGCSAIAAGLCSTPLNTTEYAAIKGDGTLGTWTSTSTMVSARIDTAALAYNGYIYAAGGCSAYSLGSCSTYLATIEYAPLKADGTIGTWSATGGSFTSARSRLSLFASAGYVYVAGGQSGGTFYSDVQYAPINGGGTLGPTWQTTTAFTTGRGSLSALANNGYLYVVGGCTSATCASGELSDVQYVKVDSPGTTTPFTTSGNAFTTTRRGGQTVAYGGFLYVMGGDNGGVPVNTIYAAAINADGTIGAFTATGMTAFTTVRTYFAAFAYNGFMYVIGGCSSAYASCTTATNDLATVYKAAIASTGTIGAWSLQTSIGTAAYGLSAVAYNNVVYVMGGLNASTFQTSIQYHTFGASGVLSGAWTTSGKTLPTSNEAYIGAAISGGYLYVVGGCSAGATTCTTTTNAVYYASLTSGGDLSSNLTSTNAFTTGRGDLGVFVNNGYIYIAGGRTNTTYSNDLQYAPLNTDGTVGTWATSSGATLSSTRYGIGAAAYNGYLYVAGGYNGTTYYTDVQSVRVNNGGGGGMTGSWTATSSLNVARYASSSVAYNGFLYVVAGCLSGACGTVARDIQYAPVNADGTLGAWHYTHDSTDDGTTFVSGLATGRFVHMVAAYNGYMYVMGGCSGGICSGFLNDSLYAPINANGTIGTWQTTTSFTTPRMGASAVAYNGYMYVMGGCTTGTGGCTTYVNDVQSAPINADGTLGSWTATTSFTTNRWLFGSMVYNGYLYILGGANPTAQNDVQYALICTGSNSGTGGCGATAGTVGTWNTTTSFIGARYGMGLSAYGGFMYIIGGNAGGAQNDVQFAPILANGALGNWQASTAFTTARFDMPAIAYNGFAYVLGGCGAGVCTSFLSDVQYAQLSALARVGHYSKLVDLGATYNVTNITFNGQPKGLFQSVSYKAAGTNAVFGTEGLGGNIMGAGGCIGAAPGTRYLLLLLTIDDSYGQGAGGAFTDASGTKANVTDATIAYYPKHPAPNIRLRAGQTLQAGDLSPLDTCGA